MSDRVPNHGSVAEYGRGCRCDPCKEARRAYTVEWRAKRLAEGAVPHGLDGYNNYGCRCEVCSDAKSEWFARPTSRSRHKALQEGYRKKNREAVKTRAAEYRERNRERLRENMQAYKQRNRDQPPDGADISHGEGGYSNYGCRCEVCVLASRDGSRLRRRTEQSQTPSEEAPRHGYQWTGVELELVVTRTDLSIVALAKMLGRTARAVRKARYRATNDPKWRQVAGVE